MHTSKKRISKKQKIVLGVSVALIAGGLTTFAVTTHDSDNVTSSQRLEDASLPPDIAANSKAEKELFQKQKEVVVIPEGEIQNIKTDKSPEENFALANEAWAKGDYKLASELYTHSLGSNSQEIKDQAQANLDIVLRQSEELKKSGLGEPQQSKQQPLDIVDVPVPDDKRVISDVPQGQGAPKNKNIRPAAGSPEKNYIKAWDILSQGNQDEALAYYLSAQQSKDQNIAQNARAMAEALSLNTSGANPLHISPGNTLKEGTTKVPSDGNFMFADIPLPVKKGDNIVVERQDHFASATVTSTDGIPRTYTTVVS